MEDPVTQPRATGVETLEPNHSITICSFLLKTYNTNAASKAFILSDVHPKQHDYKDSTDHVDHQLSQSQYFHTLTLGNKS